MGPARSEGKNGMSEEQTVLDRTRDWAFQFSFGEWQPRATIHDFMRDEFGYGGSTPKQMARRFLKRGVEANDFEVRLGGREWRWIVHSSGATEPKLVEVTDAAAA
jgi:hypothetical protein